MRPAAVLAILVFGIGSAALAAEEPSSAPPPSAGTGEITLPRLLERMFASSPDLRREEAALRTAQASYREQLSFLYPTIFFNLPAGFTFTPLYAFYYNANSSATITDSSLWDFSPNLSLTQVLPTSGTLDFSVKNSLSVYALGNPVDPVFDPFIPDTAFVDQMTFSLSLRQPIFFENAFAASLTIIERTFRLSQSRFLQARNALVARAARDYFGLIRLKAAARLAELTLAEARLSAEDARRKLGTGNISRLAALKEETRLKKAELDSFDAGAAFRNERARIVSDYGLSPEATVAEEFTPLALPELPGAGEIRARTVAGNPEIAMGREELEARKAKVTTTKCENAHTLTLGGNLVLDSANNYSTDLWSALADPFDGSSNPRLSFTFKLSLRLFDGGAAEQKIKQAEADAETSAWTLAGTTNTVSGKVDAALSGLERARLNAEYAAASLAAAAQEFEAAGRDFALGRIAKLDLDRLEIAYRSAGLEDRRAKTDLELARLDLFTLMGDDLYALLTGGKP
ncbi:MAG: TolC family protein [Spirochaetales bacterium]|nr:TolC family protein [Spirochaetales bacterium]